MSASNSKYRRGHKSAMEKGLTSVRDRKFSDEYKQNLEAHLQAKNNNLVVLSKQLDRVSAKQGEQLKTSYFEQSLKDDVKFILNNIDELVNSTSKALKTTAFTENNIVVGTTAEAVAKTFMFSKDHKRYVEKSEVELLASELEQQTQFMSQKSYDKMKEAQNEQDMSKQ